MSSWEILGLIRRAQCVKKQRLVLVLHAADLLHLLFNRSRSVRLPKWKTSPFFITAVRFSPHYLDSSQPKKIMIRDILQALQPR